MYNKIINKYITAKSDGAVGEINIWGNISSEKWFDSDITPKDIKNALDEMGDVKEIKVSVNSYGGECDSGILIYNVLDDYKKRKNVPLNVVIDGVAASMGGVIAMVGDKVTMRDNSMLMLHKPVGLSYGNAEEMRKEAEVLDKYEQRLLNIFMNRFNGTEDELRDILAAETWYLADEAKNKGLCDEIIAGKKIAASATGVMFNNVNFDKKILDKIKAINPNIKVESEDEVKDVLIYDAKLAEYGISEEDFKALASVNDLVEKIAAKSREGLVAAKDVADAKAALETKSAEYTKLADKFEAVRKEKIEEAIQNGIRANAVFNEAKWRERLKDKDYDEIMDLSNEWAQNAKDELHAGKRFTNSPTTTQNTPERKENLNF